MATQGALGDGLPVAPVAISEDRDGAVQVADPGVLFLGDYSRQGHDLLIEHDGSSVLVHDYFVGGTANFVGPNGAFLTPSVVKALAGPVAPGQYAQAAGEPAATGLVQIGKVISIEGSASATHSDGVKVDLADGAPVYQGDVVQTGDSAKLGISFVDDFVFSMSANARMVLNELIFDPAKAADSSMVVNLVQGSFVFVTGQVAPAGDMKVETPVATMGIRGTTPKVLINTDMGVTEFSILPDPDSGKIGSYILLDKTTGEIMGTVESVGDKWIITSLSGEAVKVAKSGIDLLEDEAAMSDIRAAVSRALGDRGDIGNNSYRQVAFDSSASTGGNDTQNGDGYNNGRPGGDSGGGVVDPRPDVDDVPVAQNDAFTTNEDLVLAGKNVINGSGGGPDYDPDGFAVTVTQVNGQALSFTSGTASVVLPANANLQTTGATLLIAPGGGITYDPTSAFNYLAVGEQRIDTFTYTIRDPGGYTATATVNVTVEGRNDAPDILSGPASTTLRESSEPGGGGGAFTGGPVTGQLSFTDVDISDAGHTYEVIDVNEVRNGGAPPSPLGETGLLGLLNTTGSSDSGSTGTDGTIVWNFIGEEDQFDYLGAGESVTLVYTVQVTDPHGATDTQTVTVTIIGASDTNSANDAPTITIESGDAAVAGLTETDAGLSISDTLTVTEVDLTDIVLLTVTSVTAGGTGPAFAQPSNTALLDMMSVSPSAILTDSTATQSQFTWTFNSASEPFDYLSVNETLVLTYTIRAEDDSGALNAFDTQTVTITITGTNDAPVVDAIAQTDLIEKTDTSLLATSIAVTFTDVDLTDVGHTATVTAAAASDTTTGLALDEAALIALVTPGTVTKASGSSSGSVDLGFSVASTAFDYLAVGEKLTLTYTVAINDLDGGVTPQTFVVEITGTNDAPVVDAIAQTNLDEQTDTSLLTTSIAMTFTDVDLTDVGHTATVTAAVASDTTTGLALDEFALIALVTPGTVTKASGLSDGSVDLDFSAASTAFDYLAVGEKLTLTYTVAINDLDGGVTPQTFVVEITGTNDAPVITAETLAGEVEELVTPTGNLTDTGTIAFTDVDLTDVHGVSATGTYTGTGTALGTLTAAITADTTGTGVGGLVTWTYTVAASAVEYLAEDETKLETFTIQFTDNEGFTVSKTISVTITGTNDAPVITSEVLAGDVTERAEAAADEGTAVLSDTGTIGFDDVDLTDTHMVNAVAPPVVEASAGVVIPGGGPLSTFTASVSTQTDADGPGGDDPDGVGGVVTWTFTVSDSAIEFLAAGESVTQTYTVVLNDQNTLNNTVSREVVITISGTNDAPEITGAAGEITEDNSALLATVTIDVSDPDLTDTHSVSVIEVWADGPTGAHDANFLIDLLGDPSDVAAGQATIEFSAPKSDFGYLAEGETLTLIYTVQIADGHGGSALQNFAVTISGTEGEPEVSDVIILNNAAAIEGTEGDDTYANGNLIAGTAGADLILGLAGNDDMEGRNGDDWLFGGDGDDYLLGGAGKDTYFGGAGWDMASFRDETAGVTVNLSAGTATLAGGVVEMLDSIEDIEGSAHDDTLIGNAKDNFLLGGDGTDSYDGGGGNWDQVSFHNETGGQGAIVDLSLGTGTDTYGNSGETFANIEVLRGSQWADNFKGDSGDNVFFGLAGNDTLNGGAGGLDIVRYDRDYLFGSGNGVTVDLANETATDGFGNTDTLINIDGAVGTQFNDTLTGNAGENEFVGLGGNDTIDGAGGWDWAGYWEAGSGIVVDMALATGQVTIDGMGGTDTLIDIEEIYGSQHADTISGDGQDRDYNGEGGADILTGGAGNEVFAGGEGDDQIDGGDGWDIARYDRDIRGGGDNGVTVDLSAGTATDGFGNSDTLSNVEGVWGSDFDDLLIGDDNDNELVGNDGDDTLDGGDGHDVLDGGEGADTLLGGIGDDWLFGGDGADQLTGGAGYDEFILYAGDTGIDQILDFGADNNAIFLRGYDAGDVFHLAETAPGSGDSNLMLDTQVVAFLSGVEFDSSFVSFEYDAVEQQHVVAMTYV